jgi:hypothetical protein
MNFFNRIIFSLFFLCVMMSSALAQQRLIQDYSQLMEIRDLIEIEASPTHLYILSEQEGMAVFRVYPDSLQWLYTSNGMQRRGDNIMADVRFAYLFGDSRRLTVLEPTSALGVYSSTIVTEPARAAARIDNSLYIALGRSGLGMVSLETPETVDSDLKMVGEDAISGSAVLDIRSNDLSNQLFVLTSAPQLLVFEQQDSTLNLSQEIDLDTPLSQIFIDQEGVWGSTEQGEIFEIRSSGIGQRVGATSERIQKIFKWNNRVVVRTETGRVWITSVTGTLELWKGDTNAGNYIANSLQQFWIAENNNISTIILREGSLVSAQNPSSNFSIKDIPNQIVTYPNPLILPLEMEENYPVASVDFSYRSNTDNASIRKQGFFWQPTINQTGRYWFTILATNAEGKSDSTRFMVDVRSFNSPPRFSPIRPASIAAKEEYVVEFSASDPDGSENAPIRYIGVDLPDGATINERTGEFKWTPSERQIGESNFRIIATDRLGAASSIDVKLKVLNISRGGQ